MTRLKHSTAGYLRAMQMSTDQLWVFVEGKIADRYFYGRLLDEECKMSGVRYKLVLAQDLPDAQGGGGKKVLLSFFSFLRQRRSLFTVLGNKKTTALFLLDKDVDDMKRVCKRSQHLVYTEYYCVENYLFRHGNIIDAAAACLQLDRRTIESVLGANDAWLQSAVNRWFDWTTLCLSAAMLGVTSSCNYGARSQVNTDINGSTDNRLVATKRAAIARGCTLELNSVQDFFGAIENRTKRYYSSDRHDHIFNGKWYASILEKDLSAIAISSSTTSNGLSKRIISNLLQSLNYNERWSDRFRSAIRLQLSKLAS